MAQRHLHHRGFTLLELVATLAVVAVISVAAMTRMQAPKDRAHQEESRQRLSSVQLELANLASQDPQGDFDDDVWLQLQAAGLEFVSRTTAARSSSTVSLGPLPVDSRLVAAATRSEDGNCLVLVYGFSFEGWGIKPAPEQGCAASLVASAAQVDGGTMRAPVELP
jgi:prepilin-type N-terminal cleavage/methylation domain-containing protein